ncbi:hypothetical protein IU486_19815 [Streptomyces gardneri]|nr:hypothetical protein [Streptomyces gardneri]
MTNALGMAIANRSPRAVTIIHSDHGGQFTSWAFTDRARKSDLVPSMGSIGDFAGPDRTGFGDRTARWRNRVAAQTNGGFCGRCSTPSGIWGQR